MRITFSASSAFCPGCARSSLLSVTPPVLRRSLWQPLQYCVVRGGGSEGAAAGRGVWPQSVAAANRAAEHSKNRIIFRPLTGTKTVLPGGILPQINHPTLYFPDPADRSFVGGKAQLAHACATWPDLLLS